MSRLNHLASFAFLQVLLAVTLGLIETAKAEMLMGYEEFSRLAPSQKRLVLQTLRESVVELSRATEKQKTSASIWQPLIQLIMDEAWADGRACYIGGWKSSYSPKGLCSIPTQSIEAFNQRAFDRDVSFKPCPQGTFQCQPLVFGFNRCVSINNQITDSCLAKAAPFEELLRDLTDLESSSKDLRALFDSYGSELRSYCEGKPAGQVQLCAKLEKRFQTVNAQVRGKALVEDLEERERKRRAEALAKQKPIIEPNLSEMPTLNGVTPVASLALPPGLQSKIDATTGLTDICEVTGLDKSGETLFLKGVFAVDETYPESVRDQIQEKHLKFAYLFRKKGEQFERVDNFDFGGHNPFSCMGVGGAVCDVRLTPKDQKNVAYDLSEASTNPKKCNYRKLKLDPEPCGGYETFCVGHAENLQPNPYQAVRIKRNEKSGKVEYFWCEATKPEGPYFLSQNLVTRSPINQIATNLNHGSESKLHKRLGFLGGKETIETEIGAGEKLFISRFKGDRKGLKHQVCEMKFDTKKGSRKFYKLDGFDYRESQWSFPAKGEQGIREK